jgi:hypothetical protein
MISFPTHLLIKGFSITDTNNSKIQIISGNTEVTYFYYPLEDIIKCKTVFEGKIRSILQGL